MAMAGEQREADGDDPVVVAIERVLKIEREGNEMLRRSAGDAQRQLAEARARAAALTHHADVRISKLHTAYQRKVDQDISALEQSHAASRPQAETPYDAAELAAAARRLAAKLTGGA
jgi:ElaB/YqjD/DUF883 family membrane-anchored ribosome-binding protein